MSDEGALSTRNITTSASTLQNAMKASAVGDRTSINGGTGGNWRLETSGAMRESGCLVTDARPSL